MTHGSLEKIKEIVKSFVEDKNYKVTQEEYNSIVTECATTHSFNACVGYKNKDTGEKYQIFNPMYSKSPEVIFLADMHKKDGCICIL